MTQQISHYCYDMRARARRRGPPTAGPSLSGLVAGLTVLILAIVLLALHSTFFELGRFVLFTGLAVALPCPSGRC